MLKRISTAGSLLLLSSLLALPGALAAVAADQVVTDCGDSGGPNQLRQKIAAIGGGSGVITFTCGPGNIVLQGVQINTSGSITIDGGNNITLSGNSASRLFYIGGGVLTLNNLTLTKGYVNSIDGGAVYADVGATLNINNSRFLDNEASGGSGGALASLGTLNINHSEFGLNKGANGGALYVKWPGAQATITGSYLHDNQTTDATSGWGGALLLFDGASATIHSSTLLLNHARSGAGIYVFEGAGPTRLTFDASSILVANSASVDGGGLYNSLGFAALTNASVRANVGGAASGGAGGIWNTGVLTLTNVTVNSNQAFTAGGIFNGGQTATLINVTVSGNTAYNGGNYTEGGGIWNNSGTVNLTNVTLSGNSAPAGGGVYNDIGTINLKNTLMAKGALGNNCRSATSLGFNLSDDGSCGFGGGRDNVALNLGPLADNGGPSAGAGLGPAPLGPTLTHMPAANSPARDGGTGAGCPATDQRGAARNSFNTGVACDVGSVEYGALLPRLMLPLLRR